jgi:hypothetical protein
MARKVPRIVVLSLVVAMILLGAARDFIFVNINLHLNYLWKEQDFSRAHSFLTGIFALLYFVLTWTLIKVIFNNRKFQRYAVILFGSVVAMSLLLFGGGYLFGNAHFGYDLARHFMDVVQSPIAAMILIPIFLLIQNGMGAQKEQ